MTTQESKENLFTSYECKPKRNSLLCSDNMTLTLYATQKWIVSCGYDYNDGRSFNVEKANNKLGLILHMTEDEFNELFEFR